MYDMEQLAYAQCAVYVISNRDGSDCEFLNFKPMASESELQALATRWAGRNLKGVGVAGFVNGVPQVALKTEPSDFLVIVRLTAAFARHVEMMQKTSRTNRALMTA
jgi:hypothetical protein